MVVAGAEPLWLTPEYDETSGLCLGVASSSVAAGVAKGGARVAAVLVVSPTYEGVLSDVSAIGQLCRSANVPLIVDEAHGAHLQFLPEAAPLPAPSTGGDGGTATALARFPRGALLEGADVVLKSTESSFHGCNFSYNVRERDEAQRHGAALEGHRAVGQNLKTFCDGPQSRRVLISRAPVVLLGAAAARSDAQSPRASPRRRERRARRGHGAQVDEDRAAEGTLRAARIISF